MGGRRPFRSLVYCAGPTLGTNPSQLLATGPPHTTTGALLHLEPDGWGLTVTAASRPLGSGVAIEFLELLAGGVCNLLGGGGRAAVRVGPGQALARGSHWPCSLLAPGSWSLLCLPGILSPLLSVLASLSTAAKQAQREEKTEKRRAKLSATGSADVTQAYHEAKAPPRLTMKGKRALAGVVR